MTAMKDYVCATADDIRSTVERYGVAILTDVMTPEENQKIIDQVWSTYEKVIPGFKRDDTTTWPRRIDTQCLYAMLDHCHGIGHGRAMWTVREHPAVANAFATIYNIDKNDLLTSFDGMSFHLPTEITKFGASPTADWFHTDQRPEIPSFDCIQSWFTPINVHGQQDATIEVLVGSNAVVQSLSSTTEHTGRDWVKFSDKDIAKWFSNCKRVRISCPAGSMVFWDSRTLHQGVKPKQSRATPNIRMAMYVCMMPRSLADDSTLRKRIQAYEQHRMSTHHPIRFNLQSLKSHLRFAKPAKLNYPDFPDQLTAFGRRLVGYEH